MAVCFIEQPEGNQLFAGDFVIIIQCHCFNILEFDAVIYNALDTVPCLHDSGKSFSPRFDGIDIPGFFVQNVFIQNNRFRVFPNDLLLFLKAFVGQFRVVTCYRQIPQCMQIFFVFFWGYVAPICTERLWHDMFNGQVLGLQNLFPVPIFNIEKKETAQRIVAINIRSLQSFVKL